MTEAIDIASQPEVAGNGRLSDLAYRRILETLFERKIPAGAFVSQNELVRLLGIPVAPLRDALRSLEAEGVLTIHPRSGIQFVKPGLELTRSTYQFRGIIERAAVAVYAETADEVELGDIERRHLAVVASLETVGLTEANKAEIEALEPLLHNAIVAALSNPLIDTTYRRMHNYLRIVRLDRKLTVPLAMRSLREHLAIIEACKARDPERAAAAVGTHFSAALQRHMGLY
ncbi:MAG: GntR family transcriptional regulator [Devosia sp.]